MTHSPMLSKRTSKVFGVLKVSTAIFFVRGTVNLISITSTHNNTIALQDAARFAQKTSKDSVVLLNYPENSWLVITQKV